ncbi:MAG: fibronectin type III domain-containing protein, partial [Candidatus Hydrogenedentes bacterium]|nr:fibronectin type III domain-containing protein [Candidatus Hydrogenedentota bacterium]
MRRVAALLALCLFSGAAPAQVASHPTVFDVAAGIVQRLQETYPAEKLVKATAEMAMAVMTDEDWEVLGKKHLSFRVNVPVTIHVFRDTEEDLVVDWLPRRGFKNTGLSVQTEGQNFDAWSKDFEPGVIALGVPSIDGESDHYFVSVAPRDAGDSLKVSEITPALHTLGKLNVGGRFAVSWNDTKLTGVPEALAGQVIVRGSPNRRRSARFTRVFQTTDYPATATPDHVVLTWGDDPKTTQSIQWRTSVDTPKGAVRYRPTGTGDWLVTSAETFRLANHNTVNDPLSNWHTARLDGLKPGTTYEYQVGDGTKNGWIDPAAFETAPGGIEPFKFIYLGDAQAGFDAWGDLLQQCYGENPEAKFYIMAGDLVNRGNERADWDRLFQNAASVFDHRPL